MSLTYREAGVDIDAGNELVDRIKPHVRATHREGVIGGLGGFGGLFQLPSNYREPILVSGTDGVGTKLKTAIEAGRHRGVGIDLVAMSVNDIAVLGAEPLFFLDYFASSKLDVDTAAEIIEGICDGCKQAGCALIGGETAELPGLYAAGDYDLAGFAVGVVEKSTLENAPAIIAGDVVLGLPSNGLHANGHSLARMAIFEKLGLRHDAKPDLLRGQTVADELLRPTEIYVSTLRKLRPMAKAAAHITGGGLIENIPRVLPDGLGVTLAPQTWTEPAIFELIRSAGVEENEMRRTFNLGIGMVIVVDSSRADEILQQNPTAIQIGRVVDDATKKVFFEGDKI